MKNHAVDIYYAPHNFQSRTQDEVNQLILNNIEDPFLLIDLDLRIVSTNFLTKEKTVRTWESSCAKV